MKTASNPAPPTTKEVKALVSLYKSLPPAARREITSMGVGMERLAAAYAATPKKPATHNS